MALKAHEQWANEHRAARAKFRDDPDDESNKLVDPEELVEAVRAEFAAECAAKLRSQSLAYARMCHPTTQLDLAIDIVEALARPAQESARDAARRMGITVEEQALEDIPEISTVSFPALPIDPEADKLVDGLLAKARGKTTACKHPVRELLAGLVCCQACGEVGL